MGASSITVEPAAQKPGAAVLETLPGAEMPELAPSPQSNSSSGGSFKEGVLVPEAHAVELEMGHGAGNVPAEVANSRAQVIEDLKQYNGEDEQTLSLGAALGGLSDGSASGPSSATSSKSSSGSSSPAPPAHAGDDSEGEGEGEDEDAVIVNDDAADDTQLSWVTAVSSLSGQTASSFATQLGDRVWNANDLFPSDFRSFIGSQDTLYDREAADLNSSIETAYGARDSPQFLTMARALILRFLDFESPRFDDKMVDFMLLDSSVNIFMSHIHRLGPEDADGGPAAPRSPFELLARATPRVPHADVSMQKHSYNAMEILCGGTSPILRVLTDKFELIVRNLFAVLHPDSLGNFHHFGRVLEYLVANVPHCRDHLLRSTNSIFRQRGEDMGQDYPLIYWLVPWLHEAPVANAMMVFLFPPAQRQIDAVWKRERFEALNENSWIREVFRVLSNPQTPAAALSGTAEFLVRCIEEAADTRDSQLLFRCFLTDETLVPELVGALQSESASVLRKEAVVSVLHGLLFKSTVKTAAAMPAMMMDPNAGKYLSEVVDVIKSSLGAHVGSLAAALSGSWANHVLPEMTQKIPYSAYDLREPFKTHRLMLLEVITGVVGPKPHASVMGKIPALTWRLLSNWFFEFKHNNAYHAALSKLVCAALKCNDVDTLKAAVTKTRFLSRMIEHFRDEQGATGARGYIILMCNLIRLAADALPQTDYLPNMLSSHDVWKRFLPDLREVTKKQTTHLWQFNVHSRPRPCGQFGPFVVPHDEHHEQHGGLAGNKSGLAMLGNALGGMNMMSLGVGGLRQLLGDVASQQQQQQKQQQQKPQSPTDTLPKMDEEGIDLGSHYAISLGFVAPAQKGESSSATSPTGEPKSPTNASTSPTGASKKRNRKKKKKRRSMARADSPTGRTASEGSGEESDSAEEDDGEESDEKAEGKRETAEQHTPVPVPLPAKASTATDAQGTPLERFASIDDDLDL